MKPGKFLTLASHLTIQVSKFLRGQMYFHHSPYLHDHSPSICLHLAPLTFPPALHYAGSPLLSTTLVFHCLLDSFETGIWKLKSRLKHKCMENCNVLYNLSQAQSGSNGSSNAISLKNCYVLHHLSQAQSNSNGSSNQGSNINAWKTAMFCTV